MKNKKKKINSRNKHFSLSKLFFILFLLMVVLSVALILFEYVSFESIHLFSKPVLTEITDECSIIFGNLVHQIRDSDDCTIRCQNKCVLLDSDFHHIEFISNQNSCNVCNCYCK